MAKCPKCHCKHCPVTNVYDSIYVRKSHKRPSIRRRRKCRFCGHVFYTIEQLEDDVETDRHDLQQLDANGKPVSTPPAVPPPKPAQDGTYSPEKKRGAAKPPVSPPVLKNPFLNQ